MTEPGAFECSPQQRRLWSLRGLGPALRARCAVELRGPLSTTAVEGALARAVARHEILRTTLRQAAGWSAPVQAIGDGDDFRFAARPARPGETVTDAVAAAFEPQAWAAMPGEAGGAGAAATDSHAWDSTTGGADAAATAAIDPPAWDLTTGIARGADLGVPLAAELVRFTADLHLLLLELPAWCADAATLDLLVAELAAELEGSDGSRDGAGEEPLPYADLAAWQNGLLTAEEMAPGRERWRALDLTSELAAAALPEVLPGAAGTPETTLHLPGRARWRVEAATVERLEAVAPEGGLPAVLLAAWAALLARLTARAEVVVGVHFDGRHHAALGSALGPLARCVPVPVRGAASASLRAAAAAAGRELAAASDHQELFRWEGATAAAGETAANEKADAGAPPFLAFGFDPRDGQLLEIGQEGGLRARVLDRYALVDRHVVKLAWRLLGGALEVVLEHDRHRLTAAAAEELARRFGAFLAAAAAAPDLPLAELELLSADERRRLLHGWNQTGATYPRDRCVHELFVEQAAHSPLALAAVFGEERLTYRELDLRSDALACRLQRLGVGAETLVGLLLPRSLDQLVALLATLKAGGAFLPLDPTLPPARLAAMVADARPLVVITTGLPPEVESAAGVRPLLLDVPKSAGPTRLPRLDRQETAGALHLLRLDVADSAGPPHLPDVTDAVGAPHPLQLDGASVAAAPGGGTARTERRAGPDNLAYVLFTSGSTGRPKGTLVTHRSLANYLTWAVGAYGLGAGSGAPHHTSLSFDLTLTALLAPLLAGGWVDVLAEGAGVEPLAAALRRRPGYGLVKATPSHLRLLALALDAEERGAAGRTFVLGGESLLAADTEPWLAAGGERRLVNEYGPTEAVVGCTTFTAGASPAAPITGELPVGRPIANARVYLVDASLRPVPAGVAGEVLVGGEGVARGYLGRPELTAERFLPDALSGDTGGRLYRTGDLARLGPEGDLRFLGRRDDQVKIRGFRVEPGEVASVLAEHPEVRAAAAVARPDPSSGELRIVAYAVAKGGSPLDREELRRHLAARLPDAMLPAVLVELPDLPLGPSGKVDRAALPEPEEVQETGAEAPRGALAEVVAAIWADVLGRERIGAHDDFFRLGGESMRAAQAVFRLSRALEVDLPVQALFESPTVQGLAERIDRLRRGAAEAPPLLAHGREWGAEGPPLSFAQERLWVLDQLEPGSAAFHIPVALRLAGPLDASALERALLTIVERHAPLRAAFVAVDGRPRQVLGRVRGPILRRADLRSLPDVARRPEIDRLARRETARPFDLSGGGGEPLVRGLLLATGADEHVLVLTLHHIASDGWSSAILVREAAALYAAFAAGLSSTLGELPLTYADFAAWQRRWLASGELEDALAYWRRQLAGVPPLELQGDRPRPPAQSYRGRHLPFALPSPATRALERLGRRHGASLFMVLLAAFEALLSRHGGQPSFVVGVPVAGRSRREVEDLVGCFVNTLVLRADLDGDPTFAELLARVRRTALAAYAHQDVPFERLLDELGVERDRSRAPLFQVGFTLENVPVETLELAGLTVSPLAFESGSSKYDFSLSLADDGDGLRGTLEYAVDLFDETTMRRLLAHYRTLLEAVAGEAAAQSVARLPLLGPGEESQLLREWNDTGEPARGGAPDLSLYPAFARWADRSPAAPAILYGERRWTYAELQAEVARLARVLTAQGVGCETLVAICLERSPELVTAELAVLAAGGAFLPLDPELPAERLSFMIADSGAALVLTCSALRDRLPAGAPAVLCLDALGDAATAVRQDEPEGGRQPEARPLKAGSPEAGPPEIGLLETGPPDARPLEVGPPKAGPLQAGPQEVGPPETGPREAGHPEAAAYVIYTSGSTGRPKGVVVRHAGLANLLVAQARAFGIGPGGRVLQFASPSFDAAVWELAMALGSGAALVVAGRATLADSAALAALLDRQAVTVATLPPTMLSLLSLLSAGPGDFAGLRLLVSAGEACSAELVRRWAAPGRRFVNAYGPTETTVCAMLGACVDDGAPPPIGRPLRNTRVYLLDRTLEPSPVGVAGEIHVAGPLLARGYLGRSDLTAERFLPDPFACGPGERLYATGDRARWLADGRLQYLGRADQQVKVRGHRVELGEVEAALLRHPAVREAAVVQRQLPRIGDGGAPLVAYVGAAADGPLPSAGELREHLERSLPAAMIPARFVVLPALPLTPTGKVDRRALPDPLGEDPSPESGVEPEPGTPTERRLAAIWSEVLGVARIGPRESFFALGGDSILAIQVASRAQRAGLSVQARHLFEHQTVGELAAALESAPAAESVHVPPPDVAGGEGPAEVPLTPIQRWFFARDPRNPMDLHHWNQAVLLGFRRRVEPPALEAALRSVVERHDALRLRFHRTGAAAEPGWRQEVLPPAAAAAAFSVDDLTGLLPAEQERELTRCAAARQASLDVCRGPLLAAVLFRLGGASGNRLLLVAHHLIIDAVSWRIVVEDLGLAAEQAAAGRSIDLGPAPVSFAAWAARVAPPATAAPPARPIEEHHAPLPVDLRLGPNSVASLRRLALGLDAERSRALLAAPRSGSLDGRGPRHSRVEVVVLAALAAALRRWTGSPVQHIDLESHGRDAPAEGLDPTRTVGWLTVLRPLVLRSEEGWSAERALGEVEARLRTAPDREATPASSARSAGDAAGLPAPEIACNYLGRLDRALPDAGLFTLVEEAELGPTASPRSARPHLLDVEASVRAGRLELAWSYSANLHRRESIARLAAECQDEIERLVDHAVPPGVEAIFPLTPMQEGILFHALQSPGSGAYLGQLSCEIPGAVAVEVLEAAWTRVARRHQALRTELAWEGRDRPLQVVRHEVPFAFERLDWRELPAAAESPRLEALLEAERRRGFDLSRAPLLRAVWIALPAAAGGPRHRFVLTLHHVVVDGWSMSVLLSELFQAYRALVAGGEPDLAPAPAFADYVAWLARRDGREADAFWRRYLAGFTAPTPLGLPRRPRPAWPQVAEREYRAERLSLTPAATSALAGFARRHRLTLNTLVQGAVALTLQRYAGEDDVLFGVATSGRPPELPDVERTVGLFLSTLPLRVRMAADAGLVPWLRELQAQQAEVRRFEGTPLVEIQERSALGRGTPLFETLLVFENYPLEAALGEGGGAPFAITDVRTSDETHYPLTVVAVPGESLGIGLYHDARELAPAAVRRMLRHLDAVLARIADGDDLELRQVTALPGAERQLLREWGALAAQPPTAAPAVQTRFAERAAAAPEGTALLWDGGSLTYGELDRRVAELAERLTRRATAGAGERRIGVCLERSPEMVAAVLAVLRSGAAYVPLDPDYPPQRLAFMAEDAGLDAIVTRSPLRQRLPVAIELLCVDAGDETQAGKGEPAGAPRTALPQDLAYIIYTSGSTGRPKGVLVAHAGLANVIAHAAVALAAGPGSRILQAASLSFDAAALEIFTALSTGATLCLVDAESLRDAERLGDFVRRHRVSTLIGVPSLLGMLAPESLPDVVAVMAGGEPCPAETAARWRRGRRFLNAYAPTETTIYSTLEDGAAPQNGPPGVGRPIPHTSVHILDRALRPLPAGASGEVYVGGIGVARGYHALPALTAERFVPDSCGEASGGRLYRSGDRGRWRDDGTLELLGRLDEQVKLRGSRIELGEIEAVLVRHSAVREAAAVVSEEAAGERSQRRLVAYVVLEPSAAGNGSGSELGGMLRAHLREQLPEPMVPAAVAVLAALPRLPSGKLDRRALPAPEALRGGRAARGDGHAKPRTESERLLAATWCEVLRLEPEQVGIDDNFFDLGGHSLLAIQVQNRLAERLGRRIAIVELFRHPAIRDLARHLDEHGRESTLDEPVPPAPFPASRRGGAVHLEQRQRRSGARRADEPEPSP
jgi:amino acid adenylation domain-containing protein/non-ribosomal peptide synthase protein (TIGR01720 family)